MAPPSERLIVGVIVGGRDAGSLEVFKDGEKYLIPLKPFAELSRSELLSQPDKRRLETPLGTIDLLSEDLRRIEGDLYLLQQTVEEKLATPVVFSEEEFALAFDLPWRTDRADPPPPAESPAPDAKPPGTSFSTLRTNVSWFGDDATTDLFSETVLGGRLADGYWRLRYEDDFDDRQSLREYAWLRTRGGLRYQVGHQRSLIHPLLGSLELTGLQVARTNLPLEVFSQSPEPRELLSRRLSPVANLRGLGPAAGLAELRIDGVVAARRVIGLDGVYELVDVPLTARQLTRIEVFLYDRHNLAVPVAIHEKHRSASELLLSDGAVIHLGGLGQEGNALDSRNVRSRQAGFYQFRYGLSENLSVEAAVQRSDDGTQVLGGLVTRLGMRNVLSLAAGANDGNLGYDLAFESLRGPWRLLALSRFAAAGFRAADAEGFFVHDVELGYRRSGLDVALLGLSRKDESGRRRYLLPAISWYPRSRLGLRAHPDREGEYRYDLSYRFAAGRIALSHQDASAVNLTYRVSQRYYLSLDSELGAGRRARHSAVLRWATGGSWSPSWTAGVQSSEDRWGYLLGVNAQVRSGLLARVALQDQPAGGAPRFLVGLTANLAFARGRPVSARDAAVRDDRGAVAGRVRVETPIDLPGYALDGLPILVDRRRAAVTESGGSFFAGNLKPGIYRVEIETENLPIELNPRRVSFIAEVAAAAVTRLDFVVEPEFGFAGRLVDVTGRALPEVWVEVLDAEGVQVKSAASDVFGLYRVDGLAPGSYLLRLSPMSFPEADFELPSRAVEIRDDYLFGQDLTVPIAVTEGRGEN